MENTLKTSQQLIHVLFKTIEYIDELYFNTAANKNIKYNSLFSLFFLSLRQMIKNSRGFGKFFLIIHFFSFVI